MGVSMSKSDNSYSEDSGVVYIKDSPSVTPRSDQSNKDQSSTLKAAGRKSEIVEMLCAEDDDDPEDNAWKDIYQRLESEKSQDLHNVKSDVQPIFSSSINKRGTRITSANFNPHAVELIKSDTRPRSVISPLEEAPKDDAEFQTNNENKTQENESTENIDSDVLSRNSNKVKEYSEILEHRDPDISYNLRYSSHSQQSEETKELKEASGISFSIEAPLDNEDINWNEGRLETSMSLGEDLISGSSKSFGYLSPQLFGSASENDDGLDPFDDISFPRKRKSSFGSVSIVSVKDFKDELYNEYFYEIRRCIRNYGYFERFPSPSLLRDAQMTYRQLAIPTPVNDDGKVLPHPPKERRDDVFGNQDFADVDQTVMFASDDIAENNLADVATYLCSGLEDVQKVRAIYSWITQRQMTQENLKDPKPRKYWCKVFRKLCRLSGIQTKLVHGIIRSHSYIPGQDLEKLRGCWVSVLVNQSWWIVDPVLDQSTNETSIHTRVISIETSLQQFGLTSDMDAKHQDTLAEPGGFFKDPEEFIFHYFPDADYWQLLARPVSRNELTDLAVLGVGFFKFGLKLLNHEKSVVIVDTESVLISLGYPENAHRQFLYSLYRCKEESLESEMVSVDGQTIALNRFVFMENLSTKCQVNIRVQFPHTGSYIFNLYGKDGSATKPLHICSYRLVYSNPKCSSPFPPTNRQEWGPGLDTFVLGLSPVSHKTGEIIADKKVVQVAFRDIRKLQFKFDLREDGKIFDREDIKLSFLRNKDEDIVFVLDMKPAINGVFTLNLYAKPATNKPFYNFCTYLVRKVDFGSDIPLKVSNERKIPAHIYGYRQGEAVNCEPTVAPDNGRLHLTVDTSDISKLLVELKLQDKQELNFSEHARHWIKNHTGYIDLNFPRAGKYKLRVLGRCRLTNHFKTLYEDILQVKYPSDRWSPFPKITEEWNSYYKIEEPLSQHLLEKDMIQFRLIINGAHDVAVLGPNGWYHMELADGIWTGKVQTGPRSTRCWLLARFEIGSEKFTELLMFKVISSDDLELLNERQENMRSGAINKAMKI